ncbi:hypothetical protein A2154_03965 [Candidatus Gottesmanbacteria bacterium RBG_16_43_7]|uniref:PspA/IM30 family protein n=1 Tax=Candidatus Gottesmanbacteria bacterium RBG_16_43_7 TaxID=1798373 RepID=A0A1F5Z8F3_9BACT|nr:MAG: hypothetical protein A2154_03965 [Candidatus Gottesmanbacteria bacterium RBG_16_43_7]
MNPIARFFQWFVDFLNSLVPDRSSQALLQEQQAGYAQALTDSYDSIKSSGGNIRVLIGNITKRKAELSQSELQLRQEIRSSANLTGNQKDAADRRIAMLTKIVAAKRNLVTNLENALSTSRNVQEMAEIGWQDLDTQRDLANAEASAAIDHEAMYALLEQIADAQLAATGKIKGAKIKDHRGELEERANRRQGRAETAQRVAQTSLGRPSQQVLLTDEESAILTEAYASAGVQMTASAADQTTNQAAA